jgi:PPK2 family polyphosphate:nucleotide phosphotransferase
MKKSRLAERYRVKHPDSFRLKNVDPDDCAGLQSEDKAHARLVEGVERIAELQAKLYAEHKWSLLLVIQAMDAAGKDSLIKHVMTGINPQGTVVQGFKQPTSDELDHDFLWRCQVKLPSDGHIGIFNRSYYEEVLVVRVHPEFLQAQHLPEKSVGKDIWKNRFKDIRNWEQYLSRNGTAVRKFFLHVSKGEQKKRFLSRLDEPDKNWKFSEADVKERSHWKEYMSAYEDMIRNTSTEAAPWYVVPANNKWFTRLVVAEAVIDALESLKPKFPVLDAKHKRELAAARRALLKQG